MTTPRRRRDRTRENFRGQSMVEFALLIPGLLLFMLIALDFGRVYLGYVNLQNLARIAANYAANDPTADFAAGSEYEQVVLRDAAATNCDLEPTWTSDSPPAFTDVDGDGKSTGMGDTVEVGLTCRFAILTPVISTILASQLDVSASAVFPIKEGMGAPGSGGGSPPTPAFSADDTSGTVSHTVKFFDESGGVPSGWLWEFGDGATSTQQDPTHTYSSSGVYDVKLTATNAFGSASLTKPNYITVSDPGTIDFEAVPTSGAAPLVDVQFTDLSSDNPTAWAWDFGDGGTSAIQNPTHTFTSPGPYTVSLTVTTSVGGGTVVKTDYINVSVGLCQVPDFIGRKRNQAQGLWSARGFTTTVGIRPGAPQGNFTIGFQSITGNSMVPCSSTIEIDK
jgi:PKD repeat protein